MSTPPAPRPPLTRKASGQAAWALLTEGVSGARVDLHRLRTMTLRALALVEESDQREHLYAVAGDLIAGVPSRLAKVERALDRTSYALAVMGEEFLRQRLPLEDRVRVDHGAASTPRSMRPLTSAQRVASAYLGGAPGGAEHYFFDAPRKRETREFAQSGALSNAESTALKAVRNLGESVPQEAARVDESPPTPSEVLESPGADLFSTLNRYVVNTKEPGGKGLPTSREQLPKVQRAPGENY